MATVMIKKYKGKTKTTYQLYYKHPLTGEKEYYKTYSKHKAAHRAANDLRSILDSGKLPEKKSKRLNPLTFKEVGHLLKDEWNSKLSRGDLSPKTYEDYCIWLNVLNRIFSGRLLCQITKDEIETFRNTLACDHTKVTSNRYLFIIKQVFKYGLTLNAVIENPVLDIRAFSEREHQRKEFLLPHELDRLIEATQKTRAKFYMPAIIYLGAEHAASKQEILSLVWSKVDFDFSDKGLIKLFRTKNGKERVEFLMPRSRTALISWEKHLEHKRKKNNIQNAKSDRVFCRIDGTPIKSFNKAWWNALKVAGIKNFHFHDLRHTFASNLLLSGASLKDVKEMIGHSDISMTDRYSHLTLSHKLHKQAQLADHYMNGAH